MSLSNTRIEVMQTIEKSMDDILGKFLIPIDKNWQPTDFLPDSRDPAFYEEVKEIQEVAKEISPELWAVLIGDTITEEALPTYETWLMDSDGLDQDQKEGWSQWVRGWTAEENRHGDLLNRYLYLSGQVNMREVEISTQHLINDGFDVQTGSDPYRSFVYTSFQEIATNISHRRVASLAKKSGNNKLAKICAMIAADELRHSHAYKDFVKRIFTLDPSEMMLAFADMMKKKITMPAHFLRESGNVKSSLFMAFSDTAQRINVYTTQDYIDIMESLLKDWDIGNKLELNNEAEKARDYLMALPKRLSRISERMKLSEEQYKFKWLEA
jgi:acyl-[acyl-carrier-protein] desaturase